MNKRGKKYNRPNNVHVLLLKIEKSHMYGSDSFPGVSAHPSTFDAIQVMISHDTRFVKPKISSARISS